MQRTIFDADHEAFRETVRRFCAKEVVPHHAEWEAAGIVPRELWTAAGSQGLLGFMVPEEYGGGGVRDFRYNTVLAEELTRVGASGVGFGIHNDINAPYLLDLTTDEQKARWLPGFCSGETDHRHRDDRARRRLRPAGDRHDGAGATATRTSSTAPRPSSPTASAPTW